MTRARLLALAAVALVGAIQAGAAGNDQFTVLFAAVAGAFVGLAVALRDGPP